MPRSVQIVREGRGNEADASEKRVLTPSASALRLKNKREVLLGLLFCFIRLVGYYFTLIAPRSNLIVKLVTSQTSLGPQYWIGPG